SGLFRALGRARLRGAPPLPHPSPPGKGAADGQRLHAASHRPGSGDWIGSGRRSPEARPREPPKEPNGEAAPTPGQPEGAQRAAPARAERRSGNAAPTPPHLLPGRGPLTGKRCTPRLIVPEAVIGLGRDG